jgi:hypothetical protein
MHTHAHVVRTHTHAPAHAHAHHHVHRRMRMHMDILTGACAGTSSHAPAHAHANHHHTCMHKPTCGWTRRQGGASEYILTVALQLYLGHYL